MNTKHAKNLLASIKKHGIRAQGIAELIKFLQGGKNHRAGGIKAKCADCMGYYSDGKKDCGIDTCPLYPWMPYRGQ